MINEEETDEEQIEGAREDYKEGQFKKLRDVYKEMKKEEIARIRKEIRELNRGIEFQKLIAKKHGFKEKG